MIRTFYSLLLIASCSLLACHTINHGGSTKPIEAEASNPVVSVSDGQNEPEVASIQEEYRRLHAALPRLDKVQFPFDTDYAEGNLTCWKEGEQWKVLQHRLADGHGISVEEFYFREGNLFFYLNHTEYALAHAEADNHVGQERLYCEGGTIIHALMKEHTFAFDQQVDMAPFPNKKMEIEKPEEKYSILKQKAEQLLAAVRAHATQK